MYLDSIVPILIIGFDTHTPLPIHIEKVKITKRLWRHVKLHKRHLGFGTSSSSTPPVINIWESIPLSSQLETKKETLSLSPQPSSSRNTTLPSSPTPRHPYAHINLISNSYHGRHGNKNNRPLLNPSPKETLHQWTGQSVTQHPFCITYPTTSNLELKSRITHLLPTFRGLEIQDPHKFHTEFHFVCVAMK